MPRIDVSKFGTWQPKAVTDAWYMHEMDSSRNIPPTSFLLRRDGVPCLSVGDLQAVTGAAKSGKSFACMVFAAAALSGSYLGFEAVGGRSCVLWIDTEMAPGTVDSRRRALCKAAGLDVDYHRDRLRVFDLGAIEGRQEGRKHVPENLVRRQMVFEAIRDVRPTLVVLDGIRDICADFNDMAESSGLVLDLRRLASEMGCAILTVLHENPSGDKMRGHLGTELLNKCAEVYRAKPRSDYISITTAASRNQPVGKWAFQIEEGAPVEVNLIGPDPEADRRTNLEWAAQKAFRYQAARRHTELVTEFSEYLGCGRSTAKTRINEALQDGIITKGPDGLYHLVRTGAEDGNEDGSEE